MSYGKFAVDILRSDLGFWREFDGQWVVVYQGSGDSTGPLYLRVTESPQGWTAADINSCTAFDSYEEACVAARKSDYVMKTLSLARVMQLRIKVEIKIDLMSDRPIGVLDALAEI